MEEDELRVGEELDLKDAWGEAHMTVAFDGEGGVEFLSTLILLMSFLWSAS